jgi:hypothetical protein
VSVKERVTVEGKKRKQTVDTELTLELANTKWVKPVIEF